MGLASPIPPRTQPQGHTRGHFVINSRPDAQKGLKCHQIGQATDGRLDVVQFGYPQWVATIAHLRSRPVISAVLRLIAIEK
jgi:hypothetical protein